MTDKKILFCWSGGGIAGLDIHAGIGLALAEAGIESTANAGTSAGALIAAMNSNGASSPRISQIVRGLSDDSVRRERAFWKLRVPWISSWLASEPIETLLRIMLPADFDSLSKPLSVFATEEKTGEATEFTSGRLPLALLASLSIAGVFPPVRIMNRDYSDGGTTSYLPLPSDWLSYDQVWLLVAARPLGYTGKMSIIGRILRNLDFLYEDQLNDTLERAIEKGGDKVRVIRPGVQAPRGSLHFDHDLIEHAYERTRLILVKYPNDDRERGV